MVVPNTLILNIILSVSKLKKKLKLKYCPTENMVADMLTMGLNKDTFKKIRSMAGVKMLSQ